MSNDAESPRLPFDTSFQMSMLRLICEDSQFGSVVQNYLEPQYFENEVLSWFYSYACWYRRTYDSFPRVNTVLQHVRTLESAQQDLYAAVIDQIGKAPLNESAWMRDRMLDFCKRQIFVRTYHETRTLFNSGNTEKAYDLWMQRVDDFYKTSWTPHDEAWHFEDLPARQNERMNYDPYRDSIGTGIPLLDNVLAGGLGLGETGIWVGDAKGGKSTVLVNMGVAATRLQGKKTAHFVFEDDRKRIHDRYDAAFMDEVYHKVRSANISVDKYRDTRDLYDRLSRTLMVRGFTDKWDYSVMDVHDDLQRWEREFDWKPELVIIDYGDLLRGRELRYNSETEKQKAAYRDIVSLGKRGYAIWTASQAQRPKDSTEDKEEVIRPRQISDCYEKVRVAHFIGSVNWTRAEKKIHRARLYAGAYRQNEADITIPIHCDFSKMQILPIEASQGLGLRPDAHTKPLPVQGGVAL